MIQKLKLDENLSHHLSPILSKFGYDVTTVVEEGLLSQSDIVVAAAAKKESRILLSLGQSGSDVDGTFTEYNHKLNR